MSDSNDFPKPPPPDDFSKTTPNIPISDKDKYSSSSWDKTNYSHPEQPPADDWGNTVANYRPKDGYEDFGDTYAPAANKPKVPDWGITQANINLADADFGDKQSAGTGRNEEYGVTTPYFRLPETERLKYQNIPPTPTQEAENKQQEEKARGGIPSWMWVSGGLLSMFLFAVFVLLVVYIAFWKESSYKVEIKGAPAGSKVMVNGAYWGVATKDASISLDVLKAGETKKIEITHINFKCEPETIKGEDGVQHEPIIAKCQPFAKPLDDKCQDIKAGAFDVAEQCANIALDGLGEDFSVDDLLRAMNLYIIQFASGKYDIPDRNMQFLKKAAGYMKRLPPTVQVEVGGHTDTTSTDAINQPLSENRAKAVRDALVNNFGISSDMLTEKGYGSKKPKTTNDNEDGKFQNRRIEYIAIKK